MTNAYWTQPMSLLTVTRPEQPSFSSQAICLKPSEDMDNMDSEIDNWRYQRRRRKTLQKKFKANQSSPTHPNAFVCFRLDDKKVKDTLCRLQDDIRSRHPLLTKACIDPSMFHVTLVLLILRDKDDQALASSVLEEFVTDDSLSEPIEVEYDTISCFSDRVLHATIKNDHHCQRICQMREALSVKFKESGLTVHEDKQIFMPHLTILKLSKDRSLQGKGYKQLPKSVYSSLDADCELGLKLGTQRVDRLILCKMSTTPAAFTATLSPSTSTTSPGHPSRSVGEDKAAKDSSDSVVGQHAQSAPGSPVPKNASKEGITEQLLVTDRKDDSNAISKQKNIIIPISKRFYDQICCVDLTITNPESFKVWDARGHKDDMDEVTSDVEELGNRTETLTLQGDDDKEDVHGTTTDSATCSTQPPSQDSRPTTTTTTTTTTTSGRPASSVVKPAIDRSLKRMAEDQQQQQEQLRMHGGSATKTNDRCDDSGIGHDSGVDIRRHQNPVEGDAGMHRAYACDEDGQQRTTEALFRSPGGTIDSLLSQLTNKKPEYGMDNISVDPSNKASTGSAGGISPTQWRPDDMQGTDVISESVLDVVMMMVVVVVENRKYGPMHIKSHSDDDDDVGVGGGCRVTSNINTLTVAAQKHAGAIKAGTVDCMSSPIALHGNYCIGHPEKLWQIDSESHPPSLVNTGLASILPTDPFSQAVDNNKHQKEKKTKKKKKKKTNSTSNTDQNIDDDPIKVVERAVISMPVAVPSDGTASPATLSASLIAARANENRRMSIPSASMPYVRQKVMTLSSSVYAVNNRHNPMQSPVSACSSSQIAGFHNCAPSVCDDLEPVKMMIDGEQLPAQVALETTDKNASLPVFFDSSSAFAASSEITDRVECPILTMASIDRSSSSTSSLDIRDDVQAVPGMIEPIGDRGGAMELLEAPWHVTDTNPPPAASSSLENEADPHLTVTMSSPHVTVNVSNRSSSGYSSERNSVKQANSHPTLESVEPNVLNCNGCGNSTEEAQLNGHQHDENRFLSRENGNDEISEHGSTDDNCPGEMALPVNNNNNNNNGIESRVIEPAEEKAQQANSGSVSNLNLVKLRRSEKFRWENSRGDDDGDRVAHVTCSIDFSTPENGQAYLEDNKSETKSTSGVESNEQLKSNGSLTDYTADISMNPTYTVMKIVEPNVSRMRTSIESCGDADLIFLSPHDSKKKKSNSEEKPTIGVSDHPTCQNGNLSPKPENSGIFENNIRQNGVTNNQVIHSDNEFGKSSPEINGNDTELSSIATILIPNQVESVEKTYDINAVSKDHRTSECEAEKVPNQLVNDNVSGIEEQMNPTSSNIEAATDDPSKQQSATKDQADDQATRKLESAGAHSPKANSKSSSTKSTGSSPGNRKKSMFLRVLARLGACTKVQSDD